MSSKFCKPDEFRGKEKSPDQDGGVALVLVIWIIIVLVAIVGEFSYSMRTEINITRNFREEEEAYNLALAGIEEAKAEILTAKDLSKMYMNENDILVFDPEKAEAPARKNNMGRGRFEYAVTDEDGKININTAAREQIKYVFDAAGGEISDIDTILDSIEDWKDDDVVDGTDLHHISGAEDDYYESLERPYSAKDGPFDSIEELLLIKGMSREIFVGSGADSGKNEGVRNYFTVYGAGGINVRTAPRAALEAVLGPDQANNILEQRKSGATTGGAEGGKAVSEFFSIVSTGYNADGAIRRTVKTIVKKTVNKLETVYWNDNTV